MQSRREYSITFT